MADWGRQKIPILDGETEQQLIERIKKYYEDRPLWKLYKITKETRETIFEQ